MNYIVSVCRQCDPINKAVNKISSMKYLVYARTPNRPGLCPKDLPEALVQDRPTCKRGPWLRKQTVFTQLQFLLFYL